MEKNKNYYCVIMAGGTGSRFWPVSTTTLPKQFHDILGTGRTLIQQTFDRLSKIVLTENIYVITNDEYVGLTQEQLPHISKNQIIGEPFMMNTAPCNIYMAEKIVGLNPEACLVVAPSDHLILDENLFAETVLTALQAASKEDILITLGIHPSRPDTGYGYIEFEEYENGKLRKVKSFKEKPNLETAEKFIKSEKFLWNSGIFVWSVKSILHSFQKYLPEMFAVFRNIKTYNTEQEAADILANYSKVDKISIDYGILEKSDNVWVIPSSFGWSDLGTWGALYENFNKNSEGNAIQGENIHTYHTKNTVIKVEGDKKICIIDGLTDFIVVDTKDALLICPRDKDQEVKKYVESIRENDKK